MHKHDIHRKKRYTTAFAVAIPNSSTNSPTFGSFTLLAKLARGDIGDLFLARSQGAGGFEKLVIIKRIHPQLMRDPKISELFFNEARTAAHIEHPNVRMVYEIGRNQEHHYIALEYLEGVSLVDILLARRRHSELADPRLVVSLLSQACQGLHAAHSHGESTDSGIVHGDLNPRSLFITAAGTPKILDFDVVGMRNVLATRKGFIRKTSAYMSPEEVLSGHCDHRSDIFSMGIVTWESVTGRRLFKQSTHEETRQAIINDSAPGAKSIRPDISDALNATIMRALHVDPSLRFQNSKDFGLALDRALQSEGPPLTPLGISAQIQNVFATKLKEQRLFVRAARIGKTESDNVVRSYQARAQKRAISEAPETVVAPSVQEFDEWEEAATKVVDATMASELLALSENIPMEARQKTRPVTPDPFLEVSGVVDFSDTDIAPSWRDTQNFVLPDFGSEEETKSSKAKTRAEKQKKTQSVASKPDSIAAPETLSEPPLRLSTIPDRDYTVNREKPLIPPAVDSDEQHSKKLVLILAAATFIVASAIVFVLLTRRSESSSANEHSLESQSEPTTERIFEAGPSVDAAP